MVETDSSNENLKLEEWGLPSGVLAYYKKKGISKMFPWQVECLSLGSVLDGENLIYSAPTSAGKTLVAEILVSQTVFEKQKKALIILPFVSVVREKMFYFQEMFSDSGIRVEGFMGGHTPTASFQQVQVGVCTIEKANALINRMLEEKTLDKLGIVVVDELHLLGDPYRGYLLELLLTKLKYMSSSNEEIQLQIVGMSATLPNLNALAKWLDARLYYTEFRPVPLSEHLKCGKIIMNKALEPVSEVKEEPGDDSEHLGQLCIETLRNGHSSLIFCPTKVWCENLAVKLATYFHKLGCSNDALVEGTSGWVLRQQLDLIKLKAVVDHLKASPVGLDQDLAKSVSFGVAFHHAGLTLDERDIIEGSFRNGSLRVLCATSTLSSGVNLPARRVIIRSPMNFGGIMDIMTYRQMIGRAGRMGVDTHGESILICKPTERVICQKLMSSGLKPIVSSLGSGHLSASLKRAVLEVVASGIATTSEHLKKYAAATFLAATSSGELTDPLTSCVDFLIEMDLIKLRDGGSSYAPTPLGEACLASSLPPDEGLALFRELERARRCFVLDSDLHIVYQITPYTVSEQWGKIDWLKVLSMMEGLSPSMRRVADLVGVEDSFLVRVVKGVVNVSNAEHRNKLSIHRRFYTALALHDLVNEVPLTEVAIKFDCNKGMLQQLQQNAATYAGMVSEFAKRLRWGTMELIVRQFQERLQFGVQKELCELMKLPSLNGIRARALYNAGITTLAEIANSETSAVEAALLNATPFQSKGQGAGETDYEALKRAKLQSVWVTGRAGLSVEDAADILIKEARNLLELELGVVAKWGKQNSEEPKMSQNKSSSQIAKCTNMSRVAESGIPPECSMNVSSANLSTKSQLSAEEDVPGKVNITCNEEESNTSVSVAPFEQTSTTDLDIAATSALNPDDFPCAEKEENKVLDNQENVDKKTEPYENQNLSSLENLNFETVNDWDTSMKKLIESCYVNETQTDFKVPNLVKSSANVTNMLKDLQFETICDWDSSKTGKPDEEDCFEESPKTSENDHHLSDFGQFDSVFNIESPKETEEPVEENSESSAGPLAELPSIPMRLKNPKRSRYSTDIFETSPKPCSTPLQGSPVCSYRSPDLFSQSLTFDTQQHLMIDQEDRVLPEDMPSSPLKSDDLGYLSDTPMIVAEISNVSVSMGREKAGPSSSHKRKASPDVIMGSDDSLTEEKSLKRRKVGLFRSWSKRELKRPRCEVLSDSDVEEIAGTPVDLRICSSSKTITPSRNVGTSITTTSLSKEPVVQLVNLEDECCFPTTHSTETRPSLAPCVAPIVKNWENLNVVDVCKSKELFQCFRRELKEQRYLGVSLGCRKKPVQKKPKIGARFRQIQENNASNADNFIYCSESVILDGIAIYWSENNVFYVNLSGGEAVNRNELEGVLNEIFRNQLTTAGIFDSKEQLRILMECTNLVPTVRIEDPKVASWLLSPTHAEEVLLSIVKEHVLAADALIRHFDDGEITGSLGLAVNTEYSGKHRASCEAILTYHVLVSQRKKLEEIKLLQVFQETEMPILAILAEMEVAGLHFDERKLKSIKSELQDCVSGLEKRAHSLAGRKFSLSSHVSVARVLYRELKLGKAVLTATKKMPSTSKEALETLELESKHPLPRIILQWRKLQAIINKTLCPLLQLLPKTKVHGSCHSFTVTGRITMREPNLQNVPRDFEVELDNDNRVSVCLRDLFISPPGFVLMSADYCQVELRMLAHLAKDEVLARNITSSHDIFISIAASILDKPETDVTAVDRQRAKQTCYGIIYGIGCRSLSQQLDINEEAALRLITNFKSKYFGRRPRISCEDCEHCRRERYVNTLSGRRRYLPAISSYIPAACSEAERQAVNTCVQGSAADLVKRAMVLIRKTVSEDVRLVLHLHDEVMYLVPSEKVNDVAKTIKSCMENAWALSVPFPVKVKTGQTWGKLWPITI